MKHVNIRKPVLYFALALAASHVCFADTITVDSSINAQVQNQTKHQDGLSSKTTPSTVSCPSDFKQVKISDDARQCQAFDESMTAVMIYHSPVSPSEMLSFYQAAHPSLKAHSPISGRTLLTSENKALRVIISPDKTGSQVDILVTSNSK